MIVFAKPLPIPSISLESLRIKCSTLSSRVKVEAVEYAVSVPFDSPSIMESLLLSIIYLSFPSPPFRVSAPEPPSTRSLPSPPFRVSTPSPPKRRSLSPLPFRVSAPEPP